MNDNRIHAFEVVNPKHLETIARNIREEQIQDFDDAIRYFAYIFVSTDDISKQDRFLDDWVKNVTDHQSAETNEEIIETLNRNLGGDLQYLRAYCKQLGVKLKRDTYN